MKMKFFMTMMIAAVAVMLGVCSCGDDDDEQEAALASKVVGSYAGEEILTVMGDDSNSPATYVFAKASDTTVDLTLPGMSGEGAMSLPPMQVKNIVLTKEGDVINGKIASYTGTVVNADGAEKSYTVSDLVALFGKDIVVVTYTLKYGNMPFAFVGSFSGTKK